MARAHLSPQVLSGGRRGFILKISNSTETKLWTIEPQVQIDKRFKGLPTKRIDFLLSPVGRTSQTPIIIEMDGLEYHADTVAKDLLDRIGNDTVGASPSLDAVLARPIGRKGPAIS